MRLRLGKSALAAAHDILMAAASFLVAIYLRLGTDAFDWFGVETLAVWTVAFAAVSGIVFSSMGLYRGVWRYASMRDLVSIVKAVTVALLVFLPLMFLVTRLELLPRSVLIINWFVLLALLGGPRCLYRIAKDGEVGWLFDRSLETAVPVLLVGAGDEADLFLRESARDRHARYRAVGIVDNRRRRIGQDMRGVRVLGDLDAIPDVVRDLARRGRRPQRLIVTADRFEGAEVAALLKTAERLGMTLARLPRLTDFRPEHGKPLEMRPIAIEDLLGRAQTVLDREGMAALIGGRRVLITGAGGTIGGELARQIAAFAPACLILVDANEFNLYRIDRTLGEQAPEIARKARLRDVRERRGIEDLLAQTRPEIVFHAAALKHVPLCEANPEEAVRTNAVGTRNVADACRAAGVATMVLISTDKAVNPTSVMGATKRIAESYCQALALEGRARPGATRFVTVRFGNVLASTGSVVPLFRRQIARGGPVTVTHPEVSRYFMTVKEAVELVLEASVLGSRGLGDDGGIFVLDMGAPMRIHDLARQMIRLAGLRPDRDVHIEFIGLRPGEKLHEELFHDTESLVPTDHAGLSLARPRPVDLRILGRQIDQLDEVAQGRIAGETGVLLHALVPEFAAGPEPASAPARPGASTA